MVADYKLDAMLELRKYLWRELYTREIFDKDDYWSDNLGENITPTIPVQQAAEMNQFLSGKKHIVYDKIGMSYEDNWLICCEQVLFTIYATDISDITQIRNYMIDEFRRMDDSTSRIAASGRYSSKNYSKCFFCR